MSRSQKESSSSSPIGIQESASELGNLDYFLTKYIPFCQKCQKHMELQRAAPNLKLKNVITRYFVCGCGATTHDNFRRED
jgi:hypothetical protein